MLLEQLTLAALTGLCGNSTVMSFATMEVKRTNGKLKVEKILAGMAINIAAETFKQLSEREEP